MVSNEIPISHFVGGKLRDEYLAMTPREKGKDLIINWDLLDHFNSSNDLWINFNGLDM